jgi:hypothetical protein
MTGIPSAILTKPAEALKLNFKMMKPDDLRAWIAKNGYNISSFCRMMKVQRRVMHRRLAKNSFSPHYGLLVTMFCGAYDLGCRAEGLGDPVPLPNAPGPGRPRKVKPDGGYGG